MTKLRFLTAGESHGPALTVIVEGMPAGMPFQLKVVEDELARRRLGYGRGPRMKIEQDQLELVSGVRFGRTLGSPISMIIHNTEWPKWERVMSSEGPATGKVQSQPRPGHADLAGMLKYGHADARDVLERASARETAARSAAGAVAKMLLSELGIKVFSHVTSIGGASSDPQLRPTYADLELIDASEVRAFDPEAAGRMVDEIKSAEAADDSLGGTFEVIVEGAPAGLGSYVHWDRRLDGRLGQALMSIPAIKGVEIGSGFEVAAKRGSESHDEIVLKDDGYQRKTDRAGGLEGGVSIGGTIRLRAAMKPLSTLRQPLDTVDIATGEPAKAFKERTDVCSVPAAGVVGESVVSLVIADAILERFSSDTLEDVVSSMAHFKDRTSPTDR